MNETLYFWADVLAVGSWMMGIGCTGMVIVGYFKGWF